MNPVKFNQCTRRGREKRKGRKLFDDRSDGRPQGHWRDRQGKITDRVPVGHKFVNDLPDLPGTEDRRGSESHLVTSTDETGRHKVD